MKQHTWHVSRHRTSGADLASAIDLLNHELRTPLAVLVGHSELLQEMDLEVPEDARRSLAAITRASSRLTEVAELLSRLADRGIATGSDADHSHALAPALA